MRKLLFIILLTLLPRLAIAATCANTLYTPTTWATGSNIEPAQVYYNDKLLYDCLMDVDEFNQSGVRPGTCVEDSHLCLITTAGLVYDTALTGTEWSGLTDGGNTALHSHDYTFNSTSLTWLEQNLYLAASHVEVATGAYFSTTSLQAILEDHEVRIDVLEAGISTSTTFFKYGVLQKVCRGGVCGHPLTDLVDFATSDLSYYITTGGGEIIDRTIYTANAVGVGANFLYGAAFYSSGATNTWKVKQVGGNGDNNYLFLNSILEFTVTADANGECASSTAHNGGVGGVDVNGICTMERRSTGAVIFEYLHYTTAGQSSLVFVNDWMQNAAFTVVGPYRRY